MNPKARPWPFEPMENIDLQPEYSCPAIELCCKAWYAAFQKATDAGRNPVAARLQANEAYRFAMPPLNSPKNIKAFIACVVHGMNVGAVIDERARRMLDAARAAAMYQKTPKKQHSSDSNHNKISYMPGKPAQTNSPCATVSAELSASSSDTYDRKPASVIENK